jgi:hypothetical protein
MAPPDVDPSLSPYDQIDGLDRYYFEDSWVTSVGGDSTGAVLVVEAVLTPRHPDFGPPLPAEQHRYRTIELRFEDADRVDLVLSHAPPATDASGTTDRGNLDIFVGDGHGTYSLRGDWGSLDVVGATLTVAPAGEPPASAAPPR